MTHSTTLIYLYPLFFRQKSWESDRRKLTPENFYDYYEYVDTSRDYEDYKDYQDNTRNPSIRNQFVTKPPRGFFPEIQLGKSRPKNKRRPPTKSQYFPPKSRRGGPGYVKERTSYTEGSWVPPPGRHYDLERPQLTRKKTTLRPTIFQPRPKVLK